MSETSFTREQQELMDEVEKIRTQVERTAAKFQNLQHQLADLRVKLAALHQILHP